MVKDEKRGSRAALKNAGVPVVLKSFLVFENSRALLPGQWFGRFERNSITTRRERWRTRDRQATQAMSHAGFGKKQVTTID